ncbi:MAG: hypothetical protein FJ100_04460 [Deltaproteobacteria bacterium]|nr:hypothetical protein [Deltaproteobacteria bacterium]
MKIVLLLGALALAFGCENTTTGSSAGTTLCCKKADGTTYAVLGSACPAGESQVANSACYSDTQVGSVGDGAGQTDTVGGGGGDGVQTDTVGGSRSDASKAGSADEKAYCDKNKQLCGEDPSTCLASLAKDFPINKAMLDCINAAKDCKAANACWTKK